MLSIKAIGSAVDASHYYSAGDNYYLSDQGELINATGWYGKGATLLGLSGTVEPAPFLQLLEGWLPSGQRLGIKDKEGEWQHRPATDLTFSAPKSFSLMALVGNDKRLIEVHNNAVSRALDAVEKMAAEARITVNQETGFEKTDNLVIARFQHTTSRELDALLHDHAVVMNMTQRSDGAWRSLSSRSKNDKTNLEHGFREIIYQNQHYFGLIYNSELAKGVCDVGYDIEVKDRYGNFEIKGVPEAYIKDSSKRRNQIEESMNVKGYSSAKAAEKANLDTRRSKEQIDGESLRLYWQEEAHAHGVDFEALKDASIERQKGGITAIEPVQISQTAREAIDDAIHQLSPFSTQIKHADLVRMAFMFSRGTIHHEELEAEILVRFDEKLLEGVASRYYTTKVLLEQEKNFVKQFKGSLNSGFKYSTPQSGIGADVLRSSDRVQIIDVRGLTHEKTLIESMVHTIESEGFDATVLHVGRLQSNRLSDAISRDNSSVWKWIKNSFKPDLVQTVAGFQARFEASPDKEMKKQNVVIVHDAQKLSYQDLMALDKAIEKGQGKLVLLNNSRSTEGFSAGSPLKALRDTGFVATQSTTEEKRAHFEVVETKKAQLKLAEQYASLTPETRQMTQVVALTNKDVAALNTSIRAQLKSQGCISMQSVDVRVLATQTLSESQKRHSKFFEAGDLVTFNAFTREQKHFRVMDKQSDGIVLQSPEGERRIIKVGQDENFSVTKTKTIELSIGDELVTEKNILLGRLGVIERGAILSVKSIGAHGVTLTHGRAPLQFSNDELSDLSLSHNYVRKPNQLNKNASLLMGALEGYQVNKNVLGELSEYSSNIRIFTNDKERAVAQLEKEKLTFTIDDVSRGVPSLVYRDSQYADPVIQRDLDFLVTELSKGHIENDTHKVASVALAYATAKLSERESAFEHKELLREAMVFAMGKTALPLIEEAISEKAASGELIHAGAYWISKASLALENQIIENNQKTQNTLTPIATKEQLLTMSETLTQGQKDAITLTATTCDRFTSVQGLAGVGKTTMMRELQTIARKAGYTVVGLAPMHTSKDELHAATIESITVARFLNHDVPYPEKTLFIIDESSMIGNRDYLALQNKMIALNARAVFAGDITQMQSQSSGTPHEMTVKTGTQKIAFMEEIMRQDKNPTLKKAVLHASSREIKQSFETLSTINPEAYVKRHTERTTHTGSVITVDCYDKKIKGMNYNPIYEAVANDYLSRVEDDQKNTLVIAHAHEDRAEINALIRQGLQLQGKISEHSVTTDRLSQRSMTSAERCLVSSYSEGDVLRFDAHYSIAKKGDYLTVVGVNHKTQRLDCQSKDGDLFSINPASIAQKARMSVFRSEKAALATGDAIRLRLTNPSRGFVANKEYTVEAVTETSALLRNHDDCLEIRLNHKEDAHWDYSYTSTAHGAQGSTATFVIALELAKRSQATTHRSHEIDITRPRMQVSIYTENEQALVERLSLLKGDKQSAYLLDLINNEHKIQKVPEAVEKTPVINQPHPEKSLKHCISPDEINQELTREIESLAHRLLGKPQHNQGDSMRYGRKGSLSISKSSGLWYNFETGEKGNALHLIATEMGFNDFKDTLSFAREFLNHQEDWHIAPKIKAKQSVSDTMKESPNKRAYAKKLVDESLPIKGTLAEKYLKEHRGLSQDKHAELRFIPKITTWHDDKKAYVPALLSIARDAAGEINHVQVIRLNSSTGDKDKDSKVIKQTYGQMNGYSVELNTASQSITTHLTEGVETGLSILESEPNAKVHALLSKSNFLNVDLKTLTDNVVLCVDNDGDKTFKDLVIAKAALRIMDSGRKVLIAIPDKTGHDFNDVLQEKGVSGVKKQLEAMVDAKVLLKAELKVLASQSKLSTTQDIKNVQKISDHYAKGAALDQQQLSRLKMAALNERQHLNQIAVIHRNSMADVNSKSMQPSKIPVQKELERER